MCFIRKLLDYVFSRHDLKWLDDIMPESHKREKEEQKAKEAEAEAEGLGVSTYTSVPSNYCQGNLHSE